MNGWWPDRLPLRLRVFFRGVFLLLSLATIGLAVFGLREEKRLSYRSYQQIFERSAQQIAERLRHPSGQLALLNPDLPGATLTPLRPLLLPFSAIDFDDRAKAQQATEMAGCLVQYPAHGQICIAVGNSPAAGRFIYAVGSFAGGTLVGHRMGDPDLTRAHRLLVEIDGRGRSYRWIAPLELQATPTPAHAAANGRLTGFAVDSEGHRRARPDRQFRGWLWQDEHCLEASDPSQGDCRRRSFFSVRLPVELFREDLQLSPGTWPPRDLAQIQVHVQALPPGAGAALFDSDGAGAAPPFALSDLKAQLLAGQALQIRRLGAAGGEVISLTFARAPPLRTQRLLDALIARLPVPDQQPLTARQLVTTAVGEFEVDLTADPHSLDSNLALLAGRQLPFVAAMLCAIALTWAAIELRIIHRITLLTRRAAAVKRSVDTGGLQLDLTGLRGRDELGLLTGVLSELLQRIKDDAQREHLRVEQDKAMWQAVGHEIMAPLQSLLALHGSPADPSARYVNRMRQAVRVLYGGAAPNEAILSASLQMSTLDVRGFLQTVAQNAVHAAIAGVEFDGVADAVIVKADEHSLEDVVTHVLTNADRYRTPCTAIRMTLRRERDYAEVRIHNRGPHIDPAMLGKIFEYGVSDADPHADPHHSDHHRGQGLFVARTYMAKMGGTIEAINVADGVEFVLRLALGAPRLPQSAIH